MSNHAFAIAAVDLPTQQTVSSIETCGQGSVRVERVAGRSVVTHARAQSPLRLLSPRGGEKSAWVFTSTFGGGLVAGDEIDLGVEVQCGATCMLSTQSQTKVFRSDDGGPARQSIQAVVEDDAMLVSLPDAVACFAGSTFEQRQRFDLAPSGSLLWLDWLTSGRRARGERWAFDRYVSRTDVCVGGKLVFRDALLLDRCDGPIDGEHRMGRCDCFATMFMVGPRLADAARHVLAWASSQPAVARQPLVFSASAAGGGAVIRVAGPGSEAVGHWLQNTLNFLPDLLGGNPWERKW